MKSANTYDGAAIITHTSSPRRVGVTVRTLHHYDHLGLLSTGCTQRGRLPPVRRARLLRLQQILTLKFVGFSLKQIRQLLDEGALDLAATLRMQAAVLAEKRRQVDMAITAVAQAERAIDRWHAVRLAEHFGRSRRLITMEDNGEWVKRVLH